jgi:pyruvate kinase
MSTRILVTLGPSSLDEGTVKQCAKAGVYVFRINLSHTPLEAVEPTIRKIQEWTDVPVCLDSAGAQLRNEIMADGNVVLTEGDQVRIHFDSVVGDAHNISFFPSNVARQFDVGDKIQVDFDNVSLTVSERNHDHCMAVVSEGGVVGSNKAADVNRDLHFDPLTDKDRAAIEIGKRNGIRHFALSFTNTRQDVDEMRALCGEGARIICKIESPSGVLNLEDILESADEILIDRGDLSRTVPIEKVPFLQRRIISIARSKSKPVFVATNLLESMVTTKSPTRAEVNDVVSTLLMGADGLVLAAETAIGNFPVDAVDMIRRLIQQKDKWTPNTSIREILNDF